jgi:hypothetical protein
VLDEVRKEAMNKALVAGGSTIAAEAGLLHLLKLYDNVDLSKLPQLYAEANYSRVSPETPGGLRLLPDPSTPKPKFFHLGVIRCL